MLVLTRKADETIRIGNDITITLLRVRGGQIRIGIDAPAEVSIRRGELDVKAATPKVNRLDQTVLRRGTLEDRATVASFSTAP